MEVEVTEVQVCSTALTAFDLGKQRVCTWSYTAGD